MDVAGAVRAEVEGSLLGDPSRATEGLALSRACSRWTCRLRGPEDHVGHDLGGVAGDRRCDMGVEVKRDPDRGVPESFRDDLRMHTGLQGQGRVRMAKVVQSNPGNSGRRCRSTELSGEMVGMEGLADGVAEDKVVVDVPGGASDDPFMALSMAMVAQNGHGLRVEADESLATRGLAWTDDDGVPDGRERLHDGELGRVEIHVGPAKSENLAAAHTRRCEQYERGGQPVVRAGTEQLPQIVGGPRAVLGPVDGWRFGRSR
jgi:hypothetical protein